MDTTPSFLRMQNLVLAINTSDGKSAGVVGSISISYLPKLNSGKAVRVHNASAQPSHETMVRSWVHTNLRGFRFALSGKDSDRVGHQPHTVYTLHFNTPHTVDEIVCIHATFVELFQRPPQSVDHCTPSASGRSPSSGRSGASSARTWSSGNKQGSGVRALSSSSSSIGRAWSSGRGVFGLGSTSMRTVLRQKGWGIFSL